MGCHRTTPIPQAMTVSGSITLPLRGYPQAVRDAHHATLIVATLLVVVASVLVVSTLTKTVLQVRAPWVV